MVEHSVGQGTLMNGGHANFTQTFNTIHYGISPQPTLLQALKFPGSGLREQMIEPASSGTCGWFLETTEYWNWIGSEDREDVAHRMLWIMGKAGSGKSTLLKFVVEHAREHATKSDLFFTHFFNARGGMLEKSIEGMYRTILVQIIHKLKDLSAAALLEHTRGWMPSEGGSWPIPALVNLLRAAIRMLKGRSLVFFIDALDECNNEEAQEMVYGFQSLIKEAASNGQRFRVCFASRPYPHIETDHAEYFRLDQSMAHRLDIEEYIETHLRIGPSSAQPAALRRDQIKDELLARSNCVFLWAKLVVNLLNKEYRSGRPERYDRWLKGSLGDLDKLYMEMWRSADSSYDEQDNREQILLFQWMLYNMAADSFNSRLSPRQLWWGIQLGLGKAAEEIYRRSAELDEASILRFITSTSKGLVEIIVPLDSIAVDEDARAHMSFIHESAREFVLSDAGPLKRSSGSVDDTDLELQGHLQLKDCCESLLDLLRLSSSGPLRLSWNDVRDLDTQFCELQSSVVLFDYARFHIFQHANTIQQLQSGPNNKQSEWAARFYKRFESLSATFVVDYNVTDFDFTDYDVTAVSFFSILMERGLAALMQATSQWLFKEAFDARDCRYIPGIFNVPNDHKIMHNILWNRQKEAIGVLVEIYHRLETRHGLVRDVLTSLATKGSANGWDHNRFATPPIMFIVIGSLQVAYHSHELATFLLIALIPASVTFSDDAAKALQGVAATGYVSALNHLLRNDIPTRFFQFDKLDNMQKRALEEWAIKEQEEELAATLAALRKGEISYRGFVPEEPSLSTLGEHAQSPM